MSSEKRMSDKELFSFFHRHDGEKRERERERERGGIKSLFSRNHKQPAAVFWTNYEVQGFISAMTPKNRLIEHVTLINSREQ
jgi:hypothetical protein